MAEDDAGVVRVMVRLMCFVSCHGTIRSFDIYVIYGIVRILVSVGLDSAGATEGKTGCFTDLILRCSSALVDVNHGGWWTMWWLPFLASHAMSCSSSVF
jgi:hypothetical protein